MRSVFLGSGKGLIAMVLGRQQWGHRSPEATREWPDQVFRRRQHGPRHSHVSIFLQLMLAVFLAQVLGMNTG